MTKDLLNWVLHDWETFVGGTAEFFGNIEKAGELLRDRLADPSFPPSKQWDYLCLALAAGELGAPDARGVVEELHASRSWFMQAVLAELGRRFPGSCPSTS